MLSVRQVMRIAVHETKNVPACGCPRMSLSVAGTQAGEEMKIRDPREAYPRVLTRPVLKILIDRRRALMAKVKAILMWPSPSASQKTRSMSILMRHARES